MDRHSIGRTSGGQVAADRVDGPRVALDDRGVGGAAAQGFDGERPGTPVAVEHVGTDELRRPGGGIRFEQGSVPAGRAFDKLPEE